MNQKLANMLKDLGFRLIKPSMSNKELESDRAMYERLNTDTRFKLGKKYDYICRFDKYAPNGQLDNQYFIQDIWGARKVFENMPSVHYDVGSYVAGFIAHLLGMKQKIVLIDVRKMNNDFDTKFLKEPRILNGGGGKIAEIFKAGLNTFAPMRQISKISLMKAWNRSQPFAVWSILA